MCLGYSFMSTETMSLSYWTDLPALMRQSSWQLNSHLQHSPEIQMCRGRPRQSLLIKKTHLISLRCVFLHPDNEKWYWLTFEGKNSSMCEEILWSSRTNLAQQTEKGNLPSSCLPAYSGLRDLCLVPWGFSNRQMTFEHNSFTRASLFILCLHFEDRKNWAG